MSCDACQAQGGGACPACWRKRERERELAGEARMRRDDEIWRAWLRQEISEDELVRSVSADSDKRALRQLIDRVNAKRSSAGGRQGSRSASAVFGEKKAK